MKKSFEETIQWMREQNWIKLWLKSVGYSSLDNPSLVLRIKARHTAMERENTECSIILGVGCCIFMNAEGKEYAKSIRTTMHKWMFNY